MRTVLVTGLGGAGRTTVAAATALLAAGRGRRTLFLSAEPGDVLGTPVAGSLAEPAEVTGGLWAARIEAGAAFRAEFLALQERSSGALDLLGARPLEDEELTELPGSEQFALLRALTVASRGDWDVLVVDMPPLRETIAALALPEQLRRYLRRLLPVERQAARALRPVLAQLAGVPMPAQWLYATADRWDGELAGVQTVIEARGTTLRLVAEPSPAAADVLRTARSGLALHGLEADTLVPNRILPGQSPDAWLATLCAQQEKHLREWYAQWAPGTPLREVSHLGRDPRGLEDLGALAEDGGLDVEPVTDPGQRRDDPWRVEFPATADGGEGPLYVWRLPLPGAVKEDVSLVRRGDELLVTVGPFRRIVPLPSVLRRCTVSGAGLTDGALRVRFTPDPGLWPRAR
ncbi:arsenite efflux ATP-binding protein ArsA [Streptomyces sp. SLBN-118]|uniref:ArsA family ATPase n=1 Tax=Streptomyces sp. SLBN-118 TaxID=2768454 RepID=UPI00114DBAE7|nr:ArsA-related P-loop ATPase [Streptomyces sp. SLBN-118]TQK43970.1 arsenite efflux ATP-binding protein ArsA [Streptomyces sp. SLBN-118]